MRGKKSLGVFFADPLYLRVRVGQKLILAARTA